MLRCEGNLLREGDLKLDSLTKSYIRERSTKARCLDARRFGRRRDRGEDVGRQSTRVISYRLQMRADRPLTADVIALRLSVMVPVATNWTHRHQRRLFRRRVGGD